MRKLDLGEKGGRVQFVEKPNVDPMAIIRLIQGQPKLYQHGRPRQAAHDAGPARCAGTGVGGDAAS